MCHPIYNNRKYFTTGNERPIHKYKQREQSTITPTQSEIFSVIVACSYVLIFQGHNTLQSEIFSVIVDFLICIGLLGWHTLPKWNILCYCSLFICIDLSRPQHLPKVNFFFKAVFVPWSLLVCIYYLSRPQHPPKVKYFFQIFFVIVVIGCPIFSEIFFFNLLF